jgi:hypothetical protein
VAAKKIPCKVFYALGRELAPNSNILGNFLGVLLWTPPSKRKSDPL